MTKHSICVYCGARPGNDPIYMETAAEMGQAIAAEQWRLVYGAGDVGLMGGVARAAQSAGAETFGVIPQHLLDWEVGKRDLTRFVVTETMHERKKVMVMNSDAIVVLPGGAGTLDEFFEVLTWRQLGLHNKPIVLINVGGYWDPLRALLANVIDTGFAAEDTASYIQCMPDVPSAVTFLRRALS
ncbi:TIGR00730 family Rossman fold protein [Pseudoprimorskyibacter insulae]|uniref:Cytokinin riboside 5'-monophosphate phosphoribohydrolase n=1 Tax=Pseudoprimorskyibacter insulae TaxID=1695997 RepID=A0A2R8AXX0_9RHOB|nr:TIGR00730 family Rossman fold protein [Pseudoprimorskyibacter insulae]SPF80892.1 Cytokinin riboside 5'-monophosphate phosphoribohydrolase [Pseudoprimorskyibacter insulae]